MEDISFKGKFISSIAIQKYKSISAPVKVSVAEVNPIDNNDVKTLKNVHSLWNGNFSKNIYNDAANINLANIQNADEKFYVLTRQKSNFENLNPEDILAESKIIINNPDTRSIYLDYLQVEPDNMYEAENRIYKRVGSSMLDFLKLYYPNKDIHLHSVFSSIEFYVKNGFRPIERNSSSLFYTV